MLNLLVTIIISSSLVSGAICIELGRGSEFFCWVEYAVGGPRDPDGVVDLVPEGVMDRDECDTIIELGRLILDPVSNIGWEAEALILPDEETIPALLFWTRVREKMA